MLDQTGEQPLEPRRPEDTSDAPLSGPWVPPPPANPSTPLDSAPSVDADAEDSTTVEDHQPGAPESPPASPPLTGLAGEHDTESDPGEEPDNLGAPPAPAAAPAPEDTPSGPGHWLRRIREARREHRPDAAVAEREDSEGDGGARSDSGPDDEATVPPPQPAGLALPSLPLPWTAHMTALTGIATLTFLMFVLVEPTPRWVLLVGAGAVLLGMEGTLRAVWREPFASGGDTVPYLFLPTLYTFSAPILIEHNADGYAAPLWAVVAGLGFAAVVAAEVMSVRTGSWLYPHARLVASAAAYFVAFTLFAMTYVLEPGLPAALVATWLVATMLAVALLREGEVDPVETAIFATVAGLVVAQARWLLFFLPVGDYLAGLALLLAFFLTIGLLHSHVTRQLSAAVALEYSAITAVGLALVVGARVAGIA